MRPLYAVAILLLVGGLAGGFIGHGTAGMPVLHRVVDNVVFDLSATPDGLTACLSTINGAKLNGSYGVEIMAPSGAGVWGEPLPKKVAVTDDYFQLPLRIDLKRGVGGTAAGELHFNAAACQAAGMCVPVEAVFELDATSVTREAPCRG